MLNNICVAPQDAEYWVLHKTDEVAQKHQARIVPRLYPDASTGNQQHALIGVVDTLSQNPIGIGQISGLSSYCRTGHEMPLAQQHIYHPAGLVIFP